MRRERLRLLVLIGVALAGFQQSADSQELVKKMVNEFRQSVVYLSVSRTTETGAVIQSAGTGFIVSPVGHILTSCHVVDKKLRDAAGVPLPTIVDQVSISGSVASKESAREPVSFIGCEQTPGFDDIALLRFKNTAPKRRAVSLSPDFLSFGDELASMGFPLNTEFFARGGTYSSESEDDRMLVAMVLNSGDSGAPIFNKNIRVVGIAEAGYGAGTGIGVVRPIRHAAWLLARAGVDLFAVDAQIAATPVPGSAENANLFFADAKTAGQAFSLGLKKLPYTGMEKVTVTHPVFAQVTPSTSTNSPTIDIKTIAARPGYKVTGAKFIWTGGQGVNVVHVGANPDGTAARAAFEAKSEYSTGPAFVKGFIETTQEKLP